MYEIISEKADVEEILSERKGVQILKVILEDGNMAKAINYTFLAGHVIKGDRVELNTTAMCLNLGTGGYHFVINKFNDSMEDRENKSQISIEDGHIMKLRYTPLQFRTLSLSEKNGLFHKELKKFLLLDNMPVIFIPLHSLLAPLLISYNKLIEGKKTLYIMTEGGSLPLELSKTVASLKEKKLLDISITIGNSFGGDYEAVNIFTALTAAKLFEADLVVVGIGPGHVGTNTPLGFSGTEIALYCHAVKLLNGKPILVPRLSFTEERKRHNNISHHTLTLLKKLIKDPIDVVFPDLNKIKAIVKKEKLENHNLYFYKTNKLDKILRKSNFKLLSMGKYYKDDPIFFITAGLAALRRIEIMRSDKNGWTWRKNCK